MKRVLRVFASPWRLHSFISMSSLPGLPSYTLVIITIKVLTRNVLHAKHYAQSFTWIFVMPYSNPTSYPCCTNGLNGGSEGEDVFPWLVASKWQSWEGYQLRRCVSKCPLFSAKLIYGFQHLQELPIATEFCVHSLTLKSLHDIAPPYPSQPHLLPQLFKCT